jgi:GNAT superfamily N-acetyltransferase
VRDNPAESNVRYRPFRPGEEDAVSGLIEESFREFVGRDFPSEGVAEFLDYARPEALAERHESGALILVAELGGSLVGVIELLHNEHISLLFVAQGQHGKGIGRALFTRALEIARVAKPGLTQITVHSSRHALPVYRRLGFRKAAAEKTVNGITYTPMVLKLSATGASAQPRTTQL